MDAIEQLIADFQERPLPVVSPRLTPLPDASNMARVVIGMRRSGKTYLLFQEMQRLVAADVDRGRILYVNFEDDRLQPLGPDVLDRTLETFYRLNPAARSEGAYLFLVEIQAVAGWSRFARRVLDTESARLYVSGSSAKMLSTEVSTEFRGRGFAVELLPSAFASRCAMVASTSPRRSLGRRCARDSRRTWRPTSRWGASPMCRRSTARSESRRCRTCLLYTSDAADDLLCVDLGGRRI